MFKKILIAEDIDSIAFGLATILQKLHASEIVHARYCDDALLKVRKAALDRQPFDLLLTDLSFVADHRLVTLANGEDLIRAVREVQPDIKILAYSVEDRIHKIKFLFDTLGVDGFVWKGRESASDLLLAIDMISKGHKFLPQRFSHILNPTTELEISAYDIKLITMLAQGSTQSEISAYFSQQGQSGSSSSIEKHINRLKISLKAKNSLHLVSISKDLGII